ncbi:MAG: tetratricopeptide repeat protein [Verrucomicrobiales bacterium]|nr:tetratricopeptide repeat protein [Verrucomicrobiales bacterium]
METLRSNTSNDYPSAWARWFFADRGTRTISPLATQTVADRIDSLLSESTQADSLEALSVVPSDPRALAQMAFHFGGSGKTTDETRRSQAILLYRRALRIAPEHRGALALIIQNSDQDTQVADHFGTFEAELAAHPKSVNLWIARGIALERLRKKEDAAAAFSKALELASERDKAAEADGRNMLMDSKELLQHLAGVSQPTVAR